MISPPRGWSRLRAAAIAAVCAAIVACGSAVPAAAAEPQRVPTTVAAVEEQDAQAPPLALALGDHGVATGSSFTAEIEIANTTDAVFRASDVRVSIGDPLADDDAVEAWLSGSGGTARTELASIGVEEIAPGGTAAVSEPLSVEGMSPGVYPVSAVYAGATASVTARDIVIVTGGAESPVSLVVPITGPVAVAGLYSTSTLGTLTGDDGLLTAQLDAVDGTDAILAIDPAIPASIRALGSAAPATARAWLERLMALDNDRFALQFADADVSPQIAAGLDAPLEPTHLGFALDPATIDAADEPITLSSLMRIGEGRSPQLFWPSPGSASDETVSALVGDSAASVLVPASTTANGSAVLGDDALAYDDALSHALLDAARLSDAAERERALTVATAEIWLAASQSDQPLLLALDRMGSDDLTTDDAGTEIVDGELDLSAEGLRDAVAAALTSPALSPVGLDEVLSAGSGHVGVTATNEDTAREQAVLDYLTAEPGLEHIATALTTPDHFLGQVRAELQRLLSVSWASNPDGWLTRAENFVELNADRAVAIDIQQIQQPVQLLSAEAPMPVWIRNDLPYEAKVTVIAVPDDPRLSIDRRTEIVANPDSITRATIPIEARVGSGDVTVHYTLQSATGERIGPTRDVDVTVRADWERIAVIALAVIVAALIGFGLYRQIRRRRRENESAHSDSGIREEGA